MWEQITSRPRNQINNIIEDIRGKSRFSALIVSFIGFFTLTIFDAYATLHLDNIGTQVLVISAILAMRNIYQIFLRVPLGELSQIIGRKPLIIAGTASYAIALGIMSIAFHWSLVLLAITFMAIGMSAYWPALFSYIGDLEVENYGRLNGRIFQGGDIGRMFASLFAAYLLNTLKVDLALLFGSSAVIAGYGVVLLLFILPEPLSEEYRLQVESISQALYDSFKNMMSSLVELSRKYSLRRVYIYQIVVSFVAFMNTTFFPMLIVLEKGYTKGDVALLVLISTIFVFPFKSFLGSLSDHFGWRAPTLGSLGVSSGLLFWLIHTDDFFEIAIISSIFSAAMFTCFLAGNAGVMKEAEIEKRGIAVGGLGVYVSVGRVLSSIVLAPVWEFWGLEAVFYLSSISLVIIVIYLFLFK
ncbi:MAG: MFS transporter [Candidatus Heimdallarchaeota archaeon]|nr:MFS transporter [Candidatus Heimdallarchaeota archaeon]MCK5048306.1 MFS transporter [Candidatus Heimdallarchaeota archaeon]